jgi:hypothetical protein
MSQRRFPPAWSVEETDACFIVRSANGLAPAPAQAVSTGSPSPPLQTAPVVQNGDIWTSTDRGATWTNDTAGTSATLLWLGLGRSRLPTSFGRPLYLISSAFSIPALSETALTFVPLVVGWGAAIGRLAKASDPAHPQNLSSRGSDYPRANSMKIQRYVFIITRLQIRGKDRIRGSIAGAEFQWLLCQA